MHPSSRNAPRFQLSTDQLNEISIPEDCINLIMEYVHSIHRDQWRSKILEINDEYYSWIAPRDVGRRPIYFNYRTMNPRYRILSGQIHRLTIDGNTRPRTNTPPILPGNYYHAKLYIPDNYLLFFNGRPVGGRR